MHWKKSNGMFEAMEVMKENEKYLIINLTFDDLRK